jgi:flavin reductase (DIM6/NTAB) family NADH-FMN oxidoreductase RutF
MYMEKFALDRAFTFFESGPVVLVSTTDGKKNNIMTMSWHMLLDFTPIIACCIGQWDYSYKALKKTGECVLAVPGADIMKTVVDIGNCSGEDMDKFEKFVITPQKGEKVNAPLIAECVFNLECKVMEEHVFGQDLNMFVLEGVSAWHNESLKEQRAFHAKGDGTFIIDGEHIDLRSRMTKWQDVI